MEELRSDEPDAREMRLRGAILLGEIVTSSLPRPESHPHYDLLLNSVQTSVGHLRESETESPDGFKDAELYERAKHHDIIIQKMCDVLLDLHAELELS